MCKTWRIFLKNIEQFNKKAHLFKNKKTVVDHAGNDIVLRIKHNEKKIVRIKSLQILWLYAKTYFEVLLMLL